MPLLLLVTLATGTASYVTETEAKPAKPEPLTFNWLPTAPLVGVNSMAAAITVNVPDALFPDPSMAWMV